MMGIFVQVNEHQPAARTKPIGYVLQENGCWEWVGSKDKNGYGTWVVANRTNQRAHRVMYERAKGPIPAGLVIDHLCRKRDCVNPDHLEPVTTRENLARGVGFIGVNDKKTECKYGHPLTEGHYYKTSGRKGYLRRVCKQCASRMNAEGYQRRKARGMR